MERFTDRVALVTGAGHGIGAATVRRLQSEGARIILADRDVPAAEAVAASLPEGAGFVVALELTDRNSVEAAIAAGVAHFGRLDVVANTAGGALGSGLDDATVGSDDEAWNADLDLNLTGPMRVVRAALPHLRRGGAIVLVSSANGLAAFGGLAYSAGKAGLTSLVANLAVTLGRQGIRANVVAPATVRTRVWDAQGGPDRMAALYPLGRVGEPEDIAAAIAFLASDDASWITGVTLPVDGGVLTGPNAVRGAR